MLDRLKNIFALNKAWPYLWLTLIPILLYLPSLFFNFTYLDDNVLILDNLNFLIHPANILKLFSIDVFHIMNSSAAYYRPILTLTFMIDSWISGANPFYYHLINILIHVGVVCLVYVFLKKLNIKRALAFVGALIYAVHPVLTQAVSWLPGRNDSLLALFVLAAMICFINFIEKNKWRYLIWHLVFFALAIFVKESGIVLIPIAIFYLWLLSSTKPAKAAIIKFSAGWLVIAVTWFLLRSHALANDVQYTIGEAIKAITLNSPAIIQFLGKIFFPFNLSVLPLIQDTTFIYGIIATIILVVFIIMSLRGQKNYWRVLLFGGLWFFGFLLPSFIRPDTNIVADFIEHRTYVPLIGLLIIFFKNDWFVNLKIDKRLALGLTAGGLAIFGLINIFHQQNFKDRLTFWQNAATNSPHSPLAHRNYGVMLYFDKKFPEAAAQYLAALKLNPAEQMAHNNLGVIYMNEGKYADAIQEYQAELKNNPGYDNAMFNMGLIYFNQGRSYEAAALWEQTIKVNPNYLDAYKGLALYYKNINNLEKSNYYADLLQKYTQNPE